MCSICHEDIDKCHGVVLRDCAPQVPSTMHRALGIDKQYVPDVSRGKAVVSMPTHKSFRYSSVIDTHMFPEMRVLEVRKLTDKK